MYDQMDLKQLDGFVASTTNGIERSIWRKWMIMLTTHTASAAVFHGYYEKLDSCCQLAQPLDLRSV